jgi:hypothetical protein
MFTSPARRRTTREISTVAAEATLPHSAWPRLYGRHQVL